MTQMLGQGVRIGQLKMSRDSKGGYELKAIEENNFTK